MDGLEKVKSAIRGAKEAAGQKEKDVYSGEPKNPSPLKKVEALGAKQEGDKYIKIPKRKEITLKGM